MSVNPAQYGIIKVPIKPHLKKFFLKTDHLSEPVKVEEDSILGNQVMAILQTKRSVNGKDLNNITSQFNSNGSALRAHRWAQSKLTKSDQPTISRISPLMPSYPRLPSYPQSLHSAGSSSGSYVQASYLQSQSELHSLTLP